MEDFATLQQNVQSALLATTRSASSLAAEDLLFYRSLDPAFAAQLDKQNARLLGLAQRVVGSATANTETVRPSLRDIDAVDGNWKAVIDVVDSLLERADTALDEFTGAVKRLSPSRESTPGPKTPRSSRTSAALRALDIEKPQLVFEHRPSQHEQGPFKPLLLSKPYATTSLQTTPTKSVDGELQYMHPYQQEIEQYEYPATVYTKTAPIPYHPFESTTATLVDSVEMLEEMLQELRMAKEIAIDLEHHDQRSYIGVVCLMQISTRDRDWIVDTLKPWRRKLQCLNEVFANPGILKVLHGAYMDVVWLQRDLGLYLVGLFDTHYGCRALGYPGASLAFLLKKFVGIDAQKQYQTADWRIRPLPQELLDYARSDTHYLLYIFDCMRNELIERSDFNTPHHEKDKIWDVLQRSKETALQRYEHPVYDEHLGQGPVGWYKMLSRTSTLLNKEQFAVFRAVHKWRDDVAREQDDSVHHIMPNHNIFSIAKLLPKSRAELLNTVQPTTQTIRLRADELVAVISKGKDGSVHGPEMMDILNNVEPNLRRQTQQEAPNLGVAQYVPQLADAARTSLGTPSLPLRASTSTFWGPAFDSSIWNQQEQKRNVSSSVRLAVPLPPLTAEIFADDANTAITPAKTPVQSSTPASPALGGIQDAEDDILILKQMGRKRKHTNSEALDGMATQSDEVALDADEQQRLTAKAERKKAHKEAKRAARLATMESPSAGMSTNDETGSDQAYFDYENAPDMLAPKRESREEMRKREKRQVNPYAKALDAPKGLPRIQKERAGKSMTFKS